MISNVQQKSSLAALPSAWWHKQYLESFLGAKLHTSATLESKGLWSLRKRHLRDRTPSNVVPNAGVIITSSADVLQGLHIWR